MNCEKCGDRGVMWNYGLECEMECPYCEPEPEPKLPTFTVYKGRTIYWDEVVYRDYHITHSNKPFGVRGYDFAHLDWDLGDPRHGWAATIDEAKRDIDEMEEEYE